MISLVEVDLRVLKVFNFLYVADYYLLTNCLSPAFSICQHHVWFLFCDKTGNPEGLGAELLETLVKMAPTKEEEIKLKKYDGDLSKLGSAERFLKAVLDIPFAFKRVEAMLYRANFDTEVNYLRKSFQTLDVWITCINTLCS